MFILILISPALPQMAVHSGMLTIEKQQSGMVQRLMQKQFTELKLILKSGLKIIF